MRLELTGYSGLSHWVTLTPAAVRVTGAARGGGEGAAWVVGAAGAATVGGATETAAIALGAATVAGTSGGATVAATRNGPPHDWLQLTGGSIGYAMPTATGAAIAFHDDAA